MKAASAWTVQLVAKNMNKVYVDGRGCGIYEDGMDRTLLQV